MAKGVFQLLGWKSVSRKMIEQSLMRVRTSLVEGLKCNWNGHRITWREKYSASFVFKCHVYLFPSDLWLVVTTSWGSWQLAEAWEAFHSPWHWSDHWLGAEHNKVERRSESAARCSARAGHPCFLCAAADGGGVAISLLKLSWSSHGKSRRQFPSWHSQ